MTLAAADAAVHTLHAEEPLPPFASCAVGILGAALAMHLTSRSLEVDEPRASDFGPGSCSEKQHFALMFPARCAKMCAVIGYVRIAATITRSLKPK